jgi:hypothetical protein
MNLITIFYYICCWQTHIYTKQRKFLLIKFSLKLENVSIKEPQAEEEKKKIKIMRMSHDDEIK